MNTKLHRIFSLLLVMALAFGFFQPAQAAPGDTIRVSLDANGAQTAGAQQENSISGDGRYIAFVTPFAFVTADTNGLDDVYVRDTQTNTTLLVSVATDGTLGNGVSVHPAISANGQFVVFQSNATTLTSQGIGGIFVRDLVNHTTSIVSVNNSGTPTGSPSFYPAISADGRYVAFASWARQNLTGNCGSIYDNIANVYLRDTVANITTCVSVDNGGNQMTGGNATISGDGRYVFFGSGIQLYARDTLNNTTTLMSVDSDGNTGNAESTDQASASYDGRFIAFNSAANNLVPNDTNGWKDTFVHDRDTDTDGVFDEPGAISTIRVSVATDGTQGTAYSLYPPSISADGRLVAFTSRAKNLVPGIAYDTEELYLRDTLLNTTSRISVSSSGVQASSSSQYPSMSANGHFVSFSSYASDLVSGDTNGNTDIFRHETDTIAPTVASINRTAINPVNTASVDFAVTFSENVQNVDTGDFSVDMGGSLSGVTVSAVSGSGSSYTVTVNTGTGSGLLRLDMPVTASITDMAGNPVSNLAFINGQSYKVRIQTFEDVPPDYWSWHFIERLAGAGVTGGCLSIPLNYCPTNTVTRDQMAVFLLRGKHGAAYTPPPATGTVFADIPANYWAAAWIEQLAAEGITGGCGNGNYCPTTPVTRDQMAVFLLRAEHGSAYAVPTPTGVFADVPTNYWAAAWIEQLAVEGITGGCGGGSYCPTTPVSRDQMAVFLVRTFNLP